MQIEINNQPVEAEIIPSGEVLSAREHWTLETLDRTLRSNAQFNRGYANAKLVRVDSLRVLTESTQGRYYLRYSSGAGMTEFWGHVSRRSELDFEHGIVGIVVTPNAPVDAPEKTPRAGLR